MAGMNLTRAEASERRETISTHAYRVALDLTGPEETFTSVTEIDFSAEEGSATFLDLIAHSVESVELNGNPLDTELYEDSRFPLTCLEAENTVRVVATMDYSHTGEGMHRYVDPADGKVYLYSQFEVADARRVFANFEQPDLKARFTFTVDAPSEWKVFSNYPAERTEKAGEATRWFFQETPPLSTYVTAIVAGPYEGTGGYSHTSVDGREIELGVWARASLVQYLDADEIVDITCQGLGFYEENYGHPYPFAKYDQVFVPEFNAGAMENAGLVTIVESYVFRDRPNDYVVDRRAITILHELAHMWFGDLVTMRWWDDLWLNESFAEYMSYLAAFEATRWKNAWSTFFVSEKVAALAQDQMSSTHPVAADIRDLEDVLVNFDQITYGKGGSALKQLVAWVGQENFLAGVRSYIDKYRWSNATLTDLLAELEEASGRSLESWSRMWLEESGVNTFHPEFEMDGDIITNLTLVQDCDEHASVRPHHIRVTCFDPNEEGILMPSCSQHVDITNERTVIPGFAGRTRPQLLLLNGDDLAYAKVRLDDVSLSTVRSSLHTIGNLLARAQCIFATWDMCRDGEFAATAFARLVMSVLDTLDDGTVMRNVFRALRTAVNLYSDPAHRKELRIEIAEKAFEIARAAEPGSDKQLQVADLAISLATSEDQLEEISGWLEGINVPEGFEVDAAQRWYIVIALATAGRISMEDIKTEYSRDTSAQGQAAAALAEGALPDPLVRESVWQEILDGSTSNVRQRSLCEGMARASAESVAPYAAKYFEAAESMWARHTVEIASNMLQIAFPVQLVGIESHGTDILELGRHWLEEHSDAAPACYRLVSEAVDRARRTRKAQLTDAAFHAAS